MADQRVKISADVLEAQARKTAGWKETYAASARQAKKDKAKREAEAAAWIEEVKLRRPSAKGPEDES